MSALLISVGWNIRELSTNKWLIRFWIFDEKNRSFLRDARKEEINYYPYNLTEDLMEGWIELQPKRWDEIMEELKRRDNERIKRIEQVGEIIKNVKNF